MQSLAPRVALSLSQPTTAPRSVTLSPVVLPVFVCSAGVGSFVGTATALPNISNGCNATNGTPNPNNPFAAAGRNALMRWRYDRNPTRLSDARNYRFGTGLAGDFAGTWRYAADITLSRVELRETFRNDTVPQRVADVIARGTFDFVNPLANDEDIRNYIAPAQVTDSTSDMRQVQATISKTLASLTGGPLQAAAGLAYRRESIANPSANPDNIAAPFSRWIDLNAVGATGERDVASANFEIDAPLAPRFEANLSGRYDRYSEGQRNFSPKLGLKVTPIQPLALRAAFSKGFRIPSFNESYGLPFAGFTTVAVACGTYAAYCAAHNTDAYSTASYSLGLVGVGNPTLDPEKSDAFTLGLVFEPTSSLHMTLDYWHIEVKDLVSQVSAQERALATSQYYLNNGVVTVPGITVTPGPVDPSFPNALPQLGFINYSYSNADREVVSGVDVGANVGMTLSGSIVWKSTLDLSYLSEYTMTRRNGKVEQYAGTLSPCDYTSCSGSPRWRGSWKHSFAWGRFSVTGTWYYTSGYDLAEVDYGGDPDNCAANSTGTGAPYYVGTTLPSMCSGRATWNFDLNARYRVSDRVTGYLDVLDALNIQAPVDTAAAYEGPQYNPAWAQPNVVGRMARLGIRVDF